MIQNFEHPVIDFTNTTETELKKIETTFINKDLDQKQLEFIPKYLNIEKIDVLKCNSDTSLCLEKIPSELFKQFRFITTISFNCCIIKQITSRNFVPLENLKFLTMFHCSTESIEPYAFYGLNNLQELQITDSYLTYLEPEVFCDLDNLKYLNLDANLLEKISENNFFHLKNLGHLRLSTNCIENFENGCFNGLDSLKILRLSYNKRYIILDPEIFNPISNLEVLYLNNVTMEETKSEVFKYLENLKVLDLSYNSITDVSILNHLKNLEVLDIRTYDDLTNIEKLNLNRLKYLALNQCKNLKFGPGFQRLQALNIEHFCGFEKSFFKNLEDLDFLIISPQEYSVIEEMNYDDFKFAKKFKYLKIQLEKPEAENKLKDRVDFFRKLFDSDEKIEHKISVFYSTLILEVN